MIGKSQLYAPLLFKCEVAMFLPVVFHFMVGHQMDTQQKRELILTGSRIVRPFSLAHWLYYIDTITILFNSSPSFCCSVSIYNHTSVCGSWHLFRPVYLCTLVFMVLTHKNVYEREAFAGYEDASEKTEDKSSTSNGAVTISFPDSSSDSGTVSHLAPSFPSPNEKEG